MANTFVIACPECDKQIKVSEDVIGKKIRCKECANTFVVKKPKGAAIKNEEAAKPKEAAKPAAAGAKTTAAEINASLAEEEDDGKNPYTLAEDDTGIPRCPNCILELDTREDKVCKHCGYDLVTRRRHEFKAVYEATGEDKFHHLLPGILCCVGILVVIGICIFVCVKVKGWMTGGWFQDEDDGKWIIKPGCFMLFSVLLSLLICYHLGRFAYRRLVLDNKPPEKEIEKKKDE
jgi:predicted Zn finger-like uncharacterized protein